MGNETLKLQPQNTPRPYPLTHLPTTFNTHTQLIRTHSISNQSESAKREWS